MSMILMTTYYPRVLVDPLDGYEMVSLKWVDLHSMLEYVSSLCMDHVDYRCFIAKVEKEEKWKTVQQKRKEKKIDCAIIL